MTEQARCAVKRFQLSEGRREGIEVIEVDNGTLRVWLLPQRGLGIWKVWRSAQEFGWRSPVSGPVHPMHVPIQDPSGLGWLEGFDELMCRCGLMSNGPPVFGPDGRVQFSLHGRIANLPAEDLQIRHDELTGRVDITAVVHETRFLQFNLKLTSTLSMLPGEASFSIHDVVSNLAPAATHCQLMYHHNVGLPVLGEGAEVVAPVAELAPRDARAAEGVATWSRVGAPQHGYAEQVFYTTLHAAEDGSTQVLLKSADGETGAGIRFNVRQLPCFVVWKNEAATSDGYVVGIEPSTNFPNPRPFEVEQGRAVSLASGASTTFDLRFDFLRGDGELRSAEAAIKLLMTDRDPQVHPSPKPGWSPVT
ncbi:aldose 1-epimerase family protein [Leptothrix sp. BB-4]